MNIAINDLDNSVEDLVRELSEKQKILNTYGNPNTALNSLLTGYENKKELVTAFKILFKVDEEKVFELLDEYKTIYIMKDQVEEIRTRVREIRKILDI